MSDTSSDDGLPPVLVEACERAEPLARRFADAGHTFYLVGGIVRDALVGRGGHEHDFDATTDARPDEIRRIVADRADAVWDQGARFGTVAARFGDDVYEITTHRADAYLPESRKPEVVFGDDVVADLARRDFTVNAMAVDVLERRLIDPFGGRADLARRRLRTPSGPDVSFSEDPLRMLRAARFLAGYELEPTPALVAAVETMGDRLAIVSAERIRDELEKLILLEHPHRGLDFLADTGLLGQVVPELVDVERTCWRDPVTRVEATRAVRWAALLRPLGTARARRRLGALRASNRLLGEVATLIGTAEAPPPDLAPASLRRFVHGLRGRVPADVAARFCETVGAGPEGLVAAVAELASVEDLDDLAPPLDGSAVMAELGLEPGPEVGEALEYLLELRLAEGPMGPEEARRRLAAWWERRRRRDPG